MPGWNLAAALCPPGWLVFRRLWPAVWLVLVGVLLAAGLLWGVYQWLAVPLPMLAGVALAGWLALCAGMGLYGDALMHADVQRRMGAAVAAAPNMREAVALLQRQAVNRRRLRWLAAMGVALLLAAAVAGWFAAARERAGKPAPSAAPAAKPEVVSLREPALPPATRSIGGPAQPPSMGGPDPLPAVAAETPAVQDLAQSGLPVPEPGLAPQPEPGPQPEADAPQATPASRPQASAPLQQHMSAKAAQRRLYINVGLFADPDNARRAHARLRQAGLPASIEPQVRADGRRLQRVRVGPFTSAAEANVAAARVRALGLDAVAAAQ